MTSDDVESKPLFLSSDEAQNLGDWVDKTSDRPLGARHREIARLIAFGKTELEIAEAMGMDSEDVSELSRSPRILSEVQRLQDLQFERSLPDRIKDLGPLALDAIEEGLRTAGNDGLKLREKVQLAQWLAEKIDGKAGQKINLESASIDRFLEALTDMNARGEVLDVTPKSGSYAPVLIEGETEAARSDWGEWVSSNLNPKP